MDAEGCCMNGNSKTMRPRSGCVEAPMRKRDPRVEKPRAAVVAHLRGCAPHWRRCAKVIHPQAREDYCVILKLDEGEVEIGSIAGPRGVGELIRSSRCALWRRRGKARTAGTACGSLDRVGPLCRRRGQPD